MVHLMIKIILLKIIIAAIVVIWEIHFYFSAELLYFHLSTNQENVIYTHGLFYLI